LKGIWFDESFRNASGEDVEFNNKLRKKNIKTIYIKDIEIFHNYKTTLKALIKQQYLFGKERIHLMRIADDYPFKKNNMLIYIMKRIATPFMDPWLRFVYAIKMHKNKKILYLIIGYIQQAAYWSGFISSLFLRQ